MKTGNLFSRSNLKLRKTKNIEVHVTPWFKPLPKLSVINDPVPLAYFFPLVRTRHAETAYMGSLL